VFPCKTRTHAGKTLGGMRRGKKCATGPVAAREEVRNWPSGYHFFNDDDDDKDDEVSAVKVSAAKLLKAGGTWRSYAYDSQCMPQHTERNQLLISKNGRFALQPVDEDDFHVADCKKMELDGDELTCCEAGTMLMGLDMPEGFDFSPRVVKPGVVFEVHDPGDWRKQSQEEVGAEQNVQLTTQAGDIELFFTSDGVHLSLLMRKETAASHRATLQEIAATKQQRAQERVAEVVAKEAAARKRRERLEAGGPKKKRRRKADKW
jgi:hypothetical protein